LEAARGIKVFEALIYLAGVKGLADSLGDLFPEFCQVERGIALELDADYALAPGGWFFYGASLCGCRGYC
jgi:hypothetical protein